MTAESASDESVAPASSRLPERTRMTAGLLLILAVAWSTPLRLISPDTKTDLYVDPVGFMTRALHLWDPQVTWGVLQNQGYGYLFPMGPFFAVVGSGVPMWVAQRLWWSLLLVVGYVSMVWLLRELRVRNSTAIHLAALTYALAPRVITTLGGISSEAQPVLLAPLILAPLVACSAGRMGPRRAAAISGIAALCCGGVNATATLLAIVPAGLWLLSRSGWWRRSLTAWWILAVGLATAWWVFPLLLLGRYSPPFLDWIENARTVSAPVGLLDALRGTSHWLGHLLTSSGPWWPAGHELVTDPWIILASVVLAAGGLAGIALRDVPHRGFLITLLLTGLLLISIPHSGPIASPLSGHAQALLDGPMSPLRNVHKADPLVRLPLVIGLAHLLYRVRDWTPPTVMRLPTVWRGQRQVAQGVLIGVVALSMVWVASPGIDGKLAPRGAFTEISEPWEEAADWLAEHAGDSRSLIVPAANFGEYSWGRPLDEPLRPLTDAAYAVRDAVPLTPANTVRFLDSIEQRLQTGRDLEAVVAALARTGVEYLILRNDLDTAATGAPPVIFAGSAIRSSPSISFVAGFGRATEDIVGARVSAVEIYRIDLPVVVVPEVWPVTSLTGASGGAEALPALETFGQLPGPVIFDGDAVAGPDLDRRVETDSYRARERFFGVTRGQDVSSSLTAQDDRGVPDYRPWDDDGLRSVATYAGVTSISTSTSIATEQTLVGLRPAYRPFAALDGDPATAWATFGDERPTLEIELTEPMPPGGLKVTPFADDQVFGRAPGIVTRVRVTTDAGSVIHPVDPRGGRQEVPGVGAATNAIRIEILDTTRGAPGGTLTGLAEVRLPGLEVRETVVLAPAGAGANTEAIILGVGSAGASDGCLNAGDILRCVSDEFRRAEEQTVRRDVPVVEAGEFELSGSLVANPLRHYDDLLLSPDLADASASSVRSPGAADAAAAAFDGDPRTAWAPGAADSAPQINASFHAPVTVRGIRLTTRDDWTREHAAFVRVSVDGQEAFGRLSADGEFQFAELSGQDISVTFVREASSHHFGSLEVEQIQFLGARLSPPPTELTRGCGEGPELRINGVAIHTSLAGNRDAALGFGAMAWLACSPVGLGHLDRDIIELEGWEGFTPEFVVATRTVEPPRPASQPRGVDGFERPTPARLTGQVAPGPERVVVLNDNANPGWVARVRDTPLAPLTVDGFRQAFIVPAGVQGSLEVHFAPDRAYRLGLGVGFLLALLLLPLALLPDARRLAVPSWRIAGLRRLGNAGLVGWGVLVAGVWGGVAAGLVVVGLQFGRVKQYRVAVVPGLVVAAGVVEVLAGTGVLSPQVHEAATRLLVLLGTVGAVAPHSGRSAARGSDS